MPRGVSLISNEIESCVTSILLFFQAASRLLTEGCNRIGSVFCFFNFATAPWCWVFVSLLIPFLIYGVVFILPPVHCGCVLCYWVRWIYQGQRVGQFTHRGDNYRVIGVLTLSALTVFVSSLLASPNATKHTACVALEVNQKRRRRKDNLFGPRILALLPVPSLGSSLNSCVCLIENMCSHCLQMFVHLLTPAHWVEHKRLQPWILRHLIWSYY